MRLSPAARWSCTALGALVALLYLFPLYWTYVSSLKGPGELFASPPTLWPAMIDFSGYRWIFTRENIPRYLLNSLWISAAVTALTLLLAVACAWGMARLRSRWIDIALLAVMLSQVLPPALLATPMFILFRQAGLVNTQAAVVLAIVTKTLPFAIVVLRTTFIQVPGELEEAARVDGCTRLSAIWRVVLPVARTGILVTGIIVFLLAYGDFVYPLTLLDRPALQPATVGLFSFIGAEYSDWNNIMAFACVFVTPAIAVFLLMQRQIVAGLTAGALK
ncbi:MAG: carbohydrate ABC transporter permease [Geminicoccaceae bacterium]|nr:carbohydrate ABC transporter permease [Geminicoccaceae bacterium]